MKPNIIWITLDSLRYDHTSLSDYERDTTPELRRIAAQSDGASFDNCFSHANWTFASTASMLTGMYPSRHTAGISNDALPTEVRTIPERLQDAGYNTGAISHNTHISKATNMDRGFDEFAWVNKSTLPNVAGIKTLAKYATNVRQHSGGFTLDSAKHSVVYVIDQIVKDWVRSFQKDDAPFFLYAHYNDTHHPYCPPLPYLDTYADDASMTPKEMRECSLDISRNLHETIANGCDLTNEQWNALVAMYDSGVRYIDERMGELFDWIRAQSLGETIIVFTGDHGELFGEQDLLAHMVVANQAVSHVPLITSGLNDVSGSELVQHVDVMKTLLRKAEAETDEIAGYDVETETRPFTVTQRGPDRYRKKIEKFRTYNPQFDAEKYDDGLLTVLRTPEFTYRDAEGTGELYKRDDEEVERTEAYPDQARQLGETVTELLETEAKPVTGESYEMEINDAMREQLEDLGYLVE